MGRYKHIFFLVAFLQCLPLFAQYEFIENKGQWDSRMLYRAKVPAGYLHIEKTGFNWFFYDEGAFGKIAHNHRHGDTAGVPAYYKYHVLKMDFVGAKPLTAIPSAANSTYYNYYYGKDAAKWATGVQGFYRLDLENIWQGVGIKMYSSPAGLKYDFVVAPGTPVSTVKMKYSGQEGIMVDEGRLKIKTSVNTLIEEIPEAYQYIGDTKVQVDCRYVLKGSVLGFETGVYDTSRPLIIDPVLVFITYSGSTADNFGFTATYDSRGNLYAGGNVTEAYPILPNGKYPTTAGAFQQTFAGQAASNGPYAHFPCDIAISKYDSSGKNLLYATYLGGTDNDYPHSLVVDAQDRLVMMGSTYSGDFPVLKNCFDTAKNGAFVNADIVLVKFNDNGTALLGSTFVGGTADDGINAGPLVYNYADDFRGDVMVDIRGNILVASCTESPDFPVERASQTAKKPGYDGVAFSIDSSLEKIQWSTYLGGSGQDALYSIKTDDNDNIIVGGGTISNDLPVSSKALYKSFRGGTADGFIALFDSTVNRKLKYLTYYGSSGYDQVYFVDIDRENRVYAMGQTEGNIPVKNAAYGQPNRGQFIVKLKEELDSVIFATTVGNRIGNPDISPTAFLVDNCNNIYISGWGSQISVNNHSGSTNGLPVTSGATTDGNDFWTAVLAPGAQSLLYATFFGGSQTDDHVDGGTSRFDKRGVIYQSICGSCPSTRSGANFVTDFPTTPGAAFETNLSPRCSNTSIKLDFQISYAVDARFDVNPKLGCLPLDVQLTDMSFNARHYKWDFGDGSAVDTNRNPVHTYTVPGIYRIKQVISNPNACNFSDSFFRTVEVIDGGEADFNFTQKECNNKEVTFENTSGGNNLGYEWRFPDGSTSTADNPRFEFDGPGTYMVTLVANAGTLCADSVTKSVTLKDYRLSDWKFPNVFTPGNDSLNNCYSFDGLLVECDKVKIKIFNRWGELVFTTESADDCWNGRMLNTGDELPAGVYYVVATLERLGGEKLEYTGSVTLIR